MVPLPTLRTLEGYAPSSPPPKLLSLSPSPIQSSLPELLYSSSESMLLEASVKGVAGRASGFGFGLSLSLFLRGPSACKVSRSSALRLRAGEGVVDLCRAPRLAVMTRPD
jgi:hypothetical protein